jgi:Uma2 family endonuclease
MTMPVETSRRRYTVEEYLRLEREAEEKHEFRDGEIIAISGGTIRHSLITANISGELRSLLKETPCRVFDSNLRVRIHRGACTPTPMSR